MNAPSKPDDEWRPALAAYYRRLCMFQNADSVQFGHPLTKGNRDDLEALKAALTLAPAEYARAA